MRIIGIKYPAWLVGFSLVVSILEPRAEESLFLTNIAEIRALPREVAAQGMPVKVRGVVTSAFPGPHGNFVIQDAHKGIFVRTFEAKTAGLLEVEEGNSMTWQRGMLLEIEGVTNPGGFAPTIVPKRIQVLGTAELPAAADVSLAQLLSGVFDCQRVSLTGVVQRVGTSPITVGQFPDSSIRALVELLIATEGGGHFTALSVEPEGFESAALVDASVCVRGGTLPFFNPRGELLGVRVFMTDRSDLEILRPPPPDPFKIAASSLDNLKSFSADGVSTHRQRIRGVVTLSRPGEFFYLQSGSRAVRVTTGQREVLAVGEQVEAAGFVEIPQYHAELREAVFRKTGEVKLPVPVPVPLDWKLATQPPDPLRELEFSDFDGRLVSLNGRLESIETIPGQAVRLHLNHQGHNIIAAFGDETPASALSKLRLGSDLVVTGICAMEMTASWPALTWVQPAGFRLLLRSPSDISVLRAASWWTTGRLWALLFVGMVALCGSVLWVWQLRHQLRRKSKLLVAEMRARRDAAIEFQATLRERNRLAANLHDTLLQNVTGLNYQIEACEAESLPRSERKANHLETARRMVRRAQEDLRGTVWALRVLPLHERSFAEALCGLAEQLNEGRATKITVATEGELPRLSDFVAGNLLLVAQEAIHNSLQHAHPSNIEAHVSASLDGSRITLVVSDDGVGFDPAATSAAARGHFGLEGMRERAERLGGKLRIEGRPGHGTRVVAEVVLGSFDEDLA
jgi:signal transduction histidine kinase